MCLLPNVHIIEFSKPTLLKEYHSGIRVGKEAERKVKKKTNNSSNYLNPGKGDRLAGGATTPVPGKGYLVPVSRPRV